MHLIVILRMKERGVICIVNIKCSGVSHNIKLKIEEIISYSAFVCSRKSISESSVYFIIAFSKQFATSAAAVDS